MKSITLIRPDDWHVHLRDETMLTAVVNHSSVRFKRVIVMPNLVPPISTLSSAVDYRQRILDANQESGFNPLMTLYLTDNTQAADVEQAFNSGIVKAVKYYPAGATTNSDSGVTDLKKCYAVFETMQKIQMPLLVHGEVTDKAVDIFDREQVFIDHHLIPLMNDFPQLKIVLEHITTSFAVDYVKQAGKNIAATITPHHLMFNRNHMLVGGIRPHYFCLPILKRSSHQTALRQAATSGNPKFFLGTDSAPHLKHKKESDCGCAGIYSSHAAIELYAQVFDEEDQLSNLEKFASLNGPAFYQLPINQDKMTLVKESWQIPATLSVADQQLIPLMAGQKLHWKIYGH